MTDICSFGCPFSLFCFIQEVEYDNRFFCVEYVLHFNKEFSEKYFTKNSKF